METLSNPVIDLIERFGGLSKFSSGLGHRHPTTVQGWRDSGHIPPWRLPEINALADSEGVNIGDLTLTKAGQ